MNIEKANQILDLFLAKGRQYHITTYLFLDGRKRAHQEYKMFEKQGRKTNKIATLLFVTNTETLEISAELNIGTDRFEVITKTDIIIQLIKDLPDLKKSNTNN